MNLFVGNLNPETTIATLRPLFEPFGEIVSAKIIMDGATGTSRGFGFIEMADKFQAFDAIDNIDATFFEGNIISVKEAKQNNTRGGSSGGGNRSFNRPRSPRPGGYNREGGSGYNREGGGYNRDNAGGYNRDRDNSGTYNRDRGSYNRDNNYNRDNSGGGYNRDNSSYNRNSSYGNRSSNGSNDDDRFNRL